MDNTTIDTLLFEINGKVEGISAKIDALNDTLLKHESRISILEKEITKQHVQPHWKDEVLQTLVKCVMVALTAIASLAGASTFLSGILK